MYLITVKWRLLDSSNSKGAGAEQGKCNDIVTGISERNKVRHLRKSTQRGPAGKDDVARKGRNKEEMWKKPWFCCL